MSACAQVRLLLPLALNAAAASSPAINVGSAQPLRALILSSAAQQQPQQQQQGHNSKQPQSGGGAAASATAAAATGTPYERLQNAPIVRHLRAAFCDVFQVV